MPPPPEPPAGVVGKQVKDCWGKKLGAGKNEKRRKWFSSFLIFNFNNHHLPFLSYLYTNPVDWFKNSLKWCKNSSFKVESFKILQRGYAPPAPPAVAVGKQVK